MNTLPEDSNLLADLLTEVRRLTSSSLPPTQIQPTPEDVKVKRLELIFLWPVAIKDNQTYANNQAAPSKRLQDWVDWITTTNDSKWDVNDDPFPDPNSVHADIEYAEYVYLHPFARSFLYTSRADHEYAGDHGKNGVPARNMAILERRDLRWDYDKNHGATLFVEFKPHTGVSPFELQVRDAQLYLFDTGIGMFALRTWWESASADDSRPLADVLRLHDEARRLYAPYWEKYAQKEHQRDGADKTDVEVSAGHCPLSMTLRWPKTNGGREPTISTFGNHLVGADSGDPGLLEYQRHIQNAADHHEPLTTPVWSAVAEPLRPVRFYLDDPTATPALEIEQITDDRLALLSHVAVSNPRKISAADWVRLACVDDPGDSNQFSYSTAFLHQSDYGQAAYDRFWSEAGTAPDQSWFTTRWLCSGYAFLAVGNADDHDFFLNDKTGALAHFRYHYFKLALISHFHRASLLQFKHRIADAVERLQHSDLRHNERWHHFHESIEEIELDLLTFRTMYWFTEISSQIQAQELFDLFAKHLRTRELFDQVFGEVREASEILDGRAERRLSDLGTRLAVLGALFLLIGPITAYFDPQSYGPSGIFIALGALLLGISVAPGVIEAITHFIRRFPWHFLLGGVVVLVLAFLGGLVLGRKPPAEYKQQLEQIQKKLDQLVPAREKKGQP